MPTYEYECNGCGLHFDRFQPISAAPVNACPECGADVHRVLSGGAGIIMKHGAGGPATQSSSAIRCGRPQTCCGRDERCDRPPCNP